MRTLCALLIFLLGIQSVSAHEFHPPLPRVVEVQGLAKKKFSPDQVLCSFSVISDAKTAEEARSKNEQSSKNILNGVRKLGITDTEINLESFNINEDQEYSQKEQKYIFKGYKAVKNISVELANFDLLPKLISLITQNGTNTLNHVNYRLKNPEQYRIALLKEAVSNAKDKAEAMLVSTNAKLGTVQRLIETSSSDSFPRPMPLVMMAAKAREMDAGENNSEAYSAGTIEMTVNVQAAFNII